LFGNFKRKLTMDKLTNVQVVHIIVNICDVMEEMKDYLSELDGAIGDGDHGVNMAKCFREVRKKVPETAEKDIGTILKNVGMVVLNSVGGAMGALYGTFFLRLSQESGGKNEIKLNDLVRMFMAAERGILEIGKASVGDKTLVDTLSPAVRALEKAEVQGKSLADALTDFENAAKKGMESTEGLAAKIGRASRMGERTLGHRDAGATSCYYILHAFYEGVNHS
jgi:phosphoenolpyruvate---glycerone phosphotransferase subunit DhaL